jgi:hypothetical protein
MCLAYFVKAIFVYCDLDFIGKYYRTDHKEQLNQKHKIKIYSQISEEVRIEIPQRLRLYFIAYFNTCLGHKTIIVQSTHNFLKMEIVATNTIPF